MLRYVETTKTVDVFLNDYDTLTVELFIFTRMRALIYSRS